MYSCSLIIIIIIGFSWYWKFLPSCSCQNQHLPAFLANNTPTRLTFDWSVEMVNFIYYGGLAHKALFCRCPDPLQSKAPCSRLQCTVSVNEMVRFHFAFRTFWPICCTKNKNKNKNKKSEYYNNKSICFIYYTLYLFNIFSDCMEIINMSHLYCYR